MYKCIHFRPCQSDQLVFILYKEGPTCGNAGLKKALLVHVCANILQLCIMFCALPCSAGYLDKCMQLYKMKVYTCHSKIFLLLQSNEFKYNKPQFLENAKEWTQKYATSNNVTAATVKVLLKMR